MTENELASAYRNAEGQLELEEMLAAPSGVPAQVHGELRDLRAEVDRIALEVAVIRELLELIATELEVAR